MLIPVCLRSEMRMWDEIYATIRRTALFLKVHRTGGRSVYKISYLSSKIDIGFSHVFLAVVVGVGLLFCSFLLWGVVLLICLAVTVSETNKVII